MSLIGVLSSDNYINEIIRGQFESDVGRDYLLHFPKDEDAILEFLNFDLPEIVIINFSDKKLNLTPILESIQKDAWLHNFGIVGIYDHEEKSEETLHRELSGLNILALLDQLRLQSHLVKCIKIIEANRQIIFHRELSDKLIDNATGSFEIENDALAVSVYANIAATVLFQRGYIDPEKKLHMQLGLAELIINGVEHGNCGISYEEKSAFLAEGRSVTELVEEKCKDSEIKQKRVNFEWEIKDDCTYFVIRDQGEGFDVRNLRIMLEKEGRLSLHGRGIKMARLFAHKLYYNQKGNEVTIIIKHDQNQELTTPEGFSKEEVVFTQKNDVVFEQGESSDFLYYISSGNFSVFHNNRNVGKLSPEDIFMGEMSFLLNNRRSALVKAESPGRLVKITRKSFVSVVKQYPHYGIFLSKLLARKLVRANQMNAKISKFDV